MRTLLLFLALAAATFVCAAATAHSRLASSEPAASAAVAAPAKLTLNFSEAVEPRLTGAKVLCGGRDVVVGAVRPVAGAKSVEVDLSPAAAGVCEVEWRGVSVDGRRTQGAFRFAIR